MATVLAKCVIPFLIPDALKIALAALLVRRLQGHLPGIN
jgi:biotin transporter BioY